MSQYWFVTGANRGIGLALVEQLATRKNAVVFASVRNPSKLGDLEKITAQHSNVHVVPLRLEVVEDAKKAAAEIAKITDHLDVVISNAGIAYNWERLENVDPEVARDHLTVNTLGNLILFQAVLPLLRKANKPKFVAITTNLASITEPASYPISAVALSKIGVNFIVQRIHVEHSSEGIIAFPINPGGVKTDLGDVAAPFFGFEEFPTTPADSAIALISVIDKATPEYSGRFWEWTGKELAW